MDSTLTRTPSLKAHQAGPSPQRMQNMQGAIWAFRQAIALNPHLYHAHYNLGTVLDDVGESQAALESFENALRLQPELPEAHLNRGVCLEKLGKGRLARKAYKRAMRSSATHPQRHYLLAAACHNLGRLDAAARHLEIALDTCPQDSEAHEALCLALEDLLAQRRSARRSQTARHPASLPLLGGLGEGMARFWRASWLAPATAIPLLMGTLGYTDQTPTPTVATLPGVATLTEAAAEAQRRQAMPHPLSTLLSLQTLGASRGSDRSWEPGSFNMKFGSLLIDVVGHAALSHNDNINLSKNNKNSDWIGNAGLLFDGHMPISELNTLSLRLDLGFTKYFSNSHLDSKRLLLAPGTGVDYKMYIGGFDVTLYDNLSYQEDPFQENVSNTARFKRFTNTAGVSIERTMGNVVPYANFSRTDYRTVGQARFRDLNRTSYGVSGGVNFKQVYRDWLKLGLNTSYTPSNFSRPTRSDAKTVGIGPTFEATLSEFLSLTGGASYTRMTFERGDPSKKGLTSSLGIRHRLTSTIQHSLNYSRDFSLGVNANHLDLQRSTYNIAWQANDRVTFSGNLFYEKGRETGSFAYDESFNRKGFGGGISYILDPKTTLSFAMDTAKKSSSLNNNEYRRNTATLSVRYDF